MGLTEGKPDNQKVEDKAEQCREVAIGVNNDQEKGEDCWSYDQGNSNGDDSHRLLRKGSGLLRKDQIDDGDNREQDSSCDLKVRDGDPQQNKNRFSDCKKPDADQKTCQN